MGTFYYAVEPRGGGWAYRLDDTFSPVFPTQAAALQAAKVEATRMHEVGDDTQVRVFDDDQQWRTEWVHSLDQRSR
jgi:hypothetical protein